jgi:hypothetical protein
LQRTEFVEACPRAAAVSTCGLLQRYGAKALESRSRVGGGQGGREPYTRAIGCWKRLPNRWPVVALEQPGEEPRRRRRLGDAYGITGAENRSYQDIETLRNIGQSRERTCMRRRRMAAPQLTHEHSGVTRRIGDQVFGFSHFAMGIPDSDEGRIDQVAHRADERCIVRQRRHHCDITGLADGNAAGDEPSCGN